MTRVKSYLGPKDQVQPSVLSRYENGKWVAEEKRDGVWACIETDSDGRIHSITSRTGTAFSKGDTHGLINYWFGVPNSTFIGELEATTQAAINNYAKVGYRRIWLFDVTQLLSEDVRHLTQQERRKLLELALEKQPVETKIRFPIVEQRNKNFQEFFKQIIADGGEGLVLKKLDSKYSPQTSSGKTHDWVRVKTLNTVDFYVMGIGRTPSNVKNLELGLAIDGKLKYTQSIAVPKGFVAEDLVGKIVECVGDSRMRSGALRHARFNRIRSDKLEADDEIYMARKRAKDYG